MVKFHLRLSTVFLRFVYTTAFSTGMVRCSDGTLHYTINGQDQGVACVNIPPGVFAVIDLYGQVLK